MAEEPQEPQGPQPPGLNIVLEPDKMAGVWANFAVVSHSEHEFQIDFVRRDTANPAQGIVVARVGLSPLFITQLIDALQGNWDKFVPKVMPSEVQDAGETDEPDDDSDAEA